MKRIYLDYAAAAPLDPRVERVILKYSKIFGNPSSLHESGRQAKELIERARSGIAKIISARPEEIIFTSSGTESDNLAILGIARANAPKGRHIVTTNIEHHAVLRACQKLEGEGFKVTYVPVEKNGIVDVGKVLAAIRKDTVLITIQYANSEIGTIQPIKEITKAIKGRNIIFHTDAAQAAGFLNLNVRELGVDALSLNGSKMYGPKGVGCLFIRRSINIEPIIFGGSQERGLRPGTESPALIAGFAEALAISDKGKFKESKRLEKLRDYLFDQIEKHFPEARVNGDLERRLPNNVNISFPDQDGEMLVLKLDRRGIEVSTGSACTTTETGPSQVIQALKTPKQYQNGNLRITLGKWTKKKDLDYFLNYFLSLK